MMENLMMMRQVIKNKAKLEGKAYENVYAYGYNFFTAGQYKKAKEIFKILVIAGQENIKGFIALGACLQKLEQFEQAVMVYTAGHLVDPQNAKVLFNLGLSYFSQDLYEQSEAAFLYACYTGIADKDKDPEKIYIMAEKLWKTSRSKQKKAAIELEQSLIQVD
jgi:Flp pilus assembly protein TadD